jgi:hypothetical protein
LRTYILTKTEKRIIQKFLETGDKLEGFKMLKWRIQKNKKGLNEDLELIKQFLEAKE